MERMSESFSSVVPMLASKIINSRKKMQQQSTKSTKAVPILIRLGPIAARLVELVSNVHTEGVVLCDVKPENFMLATSNTSTSDWKKECEELIPLRLRCVDLGLAATFRDPTASGGGGGGRTKKKNIREDAYPNANVLGTPAYASLNVLDGHTCSPRDDLEGVGYVVMEFVMLLVKVLKEYELTKSCCNISDECMVLPWCKGKSDKEVSLWEKNTSS